ncbi:Tigger transposable element-derived protein 6 [Holothuria leucospilota]|uniref:Tigger transposable element-derived protein 6 n=1 Tax=Holothuria leucospilota TaxID=206669 RepID=A0A9Q1HA50_HOLLE|nr:Tigger transposable element-derived protein 6 [Holothuria leucospilota]
MIKHQAKKKRVEAVRVYKNRGLNGPLASEKPEMERIRDALSGLIDGTYQSIGDAAKTQNVHYEKIRRRASGEVPWYKRKGRDPYLTLGEERHLARWISTMGKRGFPVSPKQLRDTVENMVNADGRQTPFKNGRPSRSWYKGFLRRNPSIALKPTKMMDRGRAKVTTDDVDKWFNEYACFMSDMDLCDKPNLIYNFDESGFGLSGKPPRFSLGCKDTKGSLPQISAGEGKRQTTVGMCANANGQLLPPFILFKGSVPTSWDPLAGAPPGSLASFTESGWMTQLAFQHWFKDLFIKSIGKERPVVLLLDSHQGHINFDLFKMAEENNVYLYRLLPNATHFLQPLDVGVFGFTRQLWWEQLRKWVREHPNEVASQKVVGRILGKMWENVERPNVIRKSFDSAGIYPLNRQAVCNDNTMPSETFATPPLNDSKQKMLKDHVIQTPPKQGKVSPNLQNATVLPSAKPLQHTRRNLINELPFNINSSKAFDLMKNELLTSCRKLAKKELFHKKKYFKHKNDDADADKCLCPICGRQYRIDTTLCWVGCDGCQAWYHTSCLPAKLVTKRALKRKLWYCPNCKK